jgi:hypothetical protein
MALTRIQATVGTFDDNLSAAQTMDMISFSIDEGSANVIDNTRVSSTAIENVMGLPGGGTATLEIQGDLDDAAIAAIIDAYNNSEQRTVVWVYPTGTLKTVTATAGVVSWALAGEVNGKQIVNVSLQFTGTTTIS